MVNGAAPSEPISNGIHGKDATREEVILGALAGATQLAEQILGLVRFIQNTRDAPKEVLEHIASLKQLESVTENIKTNPSYQSQQVADVLSLLNAKVKAIADILSKVRATATDDKATAIKKAVVATWKDDNVTSRLDQIERDKTTLALCLAQIDAQVQNDHIKDLASQLQSLRRLQVTSSLSEEQWSDYCLAELFVKSPVDDRAMLIRTKGTRSAGTCTWYTVHPVFRAWQEPTSTAPLLWISGGPGRGKTMISIFLTQGLERTALQADSSHRQVIFFFCDNKDHKRNGASCILRGLILQVLARYPILVKHLLPEFKLQRSKLFEESSFDSLWRVFEGIIYHSPTKITYIVVDGLDELRTDALDVLLQKFRVLNISKVKAIALSRPFPQSISEAFCDSPSVRLDLDSDKEVRSDVNTYVRGGGY
ncbi:hypothetical protein H2200_009850 [Cladophialophora chaetospira]|uniref:Nephrocystin 3-like N-terminal domain-containing protein n=1 Tax=Cladophialophora chaetospira TaxID=386627 RepID=A0AA38X376_9EURO|nr:hypothetical protein H2200_009850 [Cladophialophora chaetospira]